MGELESEDLRHHQSILKSERTSRLFYSSLKSSAFNLCFLILGYGAAAVD